jgi:hypothetical protein
MHLVDKRSTRSIEAVDIGFDIGVELTGAQTVVQIGMDRRAEEGDRNDAGGIDLDMKIRFLNPLIDRTNRKLPVGEACAALGNTCRIDIV